MSFAFKMKQQKSVVPKPLAFSVSNKVFINQLLEILIIQDDHTHSLEWDPGRRERGSGQRMIEIDLQ